MRQLFWLTRPARWDTLKQG